jgi:hypothetical protein
LSLSGPNSLLITLFPNTLSLSYSLSISDEVSRPCKTKGKVIVLYILIFKFLGSKLEDRRFFTEWTRMTCTICTSPSRETCDYRFGMSLQMAAIWVINRIIVVHMYRAL